MGIFALFVIYFDKFTPEHSYTRFMSLKGKIGFWQKGIPGSPWKTVHNFKFWKFFCVTAAYHFNQYKTPSFLCCKLILHSLRNPKFLSKLEIPNFLSQNP